MKLLGFGKGATKRKQATAPPETDSPKGAKKSTAMSLSWGYIFGLHRQMALEAIKRLVATPIGSGMNCLMIALAFVLPATFYLFVENVQQLSNGWSGNPRISLYLSAQVPANQLDELTQHLSDNQLIVATTYISPEEGLARFQQQIGMADITSDLGFNPLPAVLQLDVRAGVQGAALNDLTQELQRLSGVEHVRLDKEWIERLVAITGLLEQVAIGLSILLALTIWLAISNTVGLSIEARKDELRVIKLIGGGDSFIMLPFIYTGIIYGVAGAALAVAVVWCALWVITPSIVTLSGLYGSNFQLVGFNIELFLILALTGGGLGLLGAWASCLKQLQQYEPR